MVQIKKSEALWRIISRYDHYYGTTNSKAALLLAFNTAVIASIIIKFEDILSIYETHNICKCIASISLIVIIFSTIVSVWYVFKAINPFLKSHKNPKNYHSVIFFNHVAEFESQDDYYETIKKINEEEFIKDQSFQIHSLAKGLRTKFNYFKIAVIANSVQLLFIAILVIIKIIIVFVNVSNQVPKGTTP